MRAGMGRTLAIYEVHTATGMLRMLVGHVERAYQPPTAWPGVVGYTPGRNMYRFLADEIDEPRLDERYRRHGHFWERIRDLRADLAEDGLIVGPKKKAPR